MMHLLHVGYPKAGSTFLQKWFEKHPQTVFRHGGLGGFNHLHDMLQASEELDTDRYKYYVTSSEFFAVGAPSQLSNSSLDFYLNNPEIYCNFLNSFFPNSKILIVTRGFKEIVKSGYAQQIKNGGISDYHIIPSDHSHYINSLNYNRLINIYQQKFGADNVIILPYELLRDNAEEFLQKLQFKLDLDPIHYNPGIVNARSSAADLYWMLKLNRFLNRFRKILGDKIFFKIYRRHVHYNHHNKYKFIFRILRLIFKSKSLEELLISDEILSVFSKFATKLETDKLYKPYSRDYLFENK